MSTRSGSPASPWILMLAMVWSLTLDACGGPTLKNGVFRAEHTAFKVGPIPEDWEPLPDVAKDPDLASFAFRDSDTHATVGVAARCHRDGDDVPLRALTQHLYIGFTDRQTRSEREFTLDGRAALRTEMVASLDGVPKDLVFVVLKKDGCVYDFWRVGAYEAADPDFEAFVSGFQVLPS